MKQCIIYKDESKRRILFDSRLARNFILGPSWSSSKKRYPKLSDDGSPGKLYFYFGNSDLIWTIY